MGSNQDNKTAEEIAKEIADAEAQKQAEIEAEALRVAEELTAKATAEAEAKALAEAEAKALADAEAVKKEEEQAIADSKINDNELIAKLNELEKFKNDAILESQQTAFENRMLKANVPAEVQAELLKTTDVSNYETINLDLFASTTPTGTPILQENLPDGKETIGTDFMKSIIAESKRRI